MIWMLLIAPVNFNGQFFCLLKTKNARKKDSSENVLTISVRKPNSIESDDRKEFVIKIYTDLLKKQY